MHKFFFGAAAAVVVVVLSGAACSVSTKSSRPDGGVYKSMDRGSTWQQVVFVGKTQKSTITIANLDIKQLLFSPLDKTTLYAVAPDGVWETRNAGEQWRQLFKGAVSGFAPHTVNRDVLYVASGNRIFTSLDGGAAWKPVYLESAPQVAFTDIALDPKEPRRVYVTSSSLAFLKSDDDGGNWRSEYTFTEPVARLFVSPSLPRVLYAAHPSGNLERSADAGVTWTSITPSKSEVRRFRVGPYRSLTFMPQRPDGLFYATQYGLWRSLNGGVTWESVELVTQTDAVTIGGLVVDDKRELDITYVTSGTLYRSVDGGKSWATLPLPSGRQPTALIAQPDDGKMLYLGMSRASKKK